MAGRYNINQANSRNKLKVTFVVGGVDLCFWLRLIYMCMDATELANSWYLALKSISNVG